MSESRNRKISEEKTWKLGWMQWLNIIEVLTAIILGIFFGWAWLALIFLIFVRATTVAEGTSKIIMRFGGEVKVFIQWVGNILNQEGNVESVTGPAKKPRYGGLRIWIGTPWDKEHEYDLRWHSIEEIQGKRVPAFREKITNNVNLRPDRYWRKSIKAETADGQFPDVEWLIGLRSINPGKTIFKSPHNWIENALTELEPTLRQYVRTKTLKQLLNLTREQIWIDIGNDRAIQIVLKTEWGIQIDDKEIGIFDANLSPEDQAALAKESRENLLGKAKIAREKKERAAERIELRHVRDRAQEIRDGVRLTPKDAMEVVQTERNKVTKEIIEYKGLERAGGLPLIHIGGEEVLPRKSKEKKEKKEKEEKKDEEIPEDELRPYYKK